MKHTRSLISLLLVSLSMSAAVSAEVSLSGYFEPQFTGTVLNDEWLQMNSNKLRLDLSADLSDNISFTGNVNYINYNGKTEWSLLDFLPDTQAAALAGVDPDVFRYEYEDDQKLDNAYLRLYSGRLTATIGRQQFSVGSGYTWNPTDLFNTKDILDPTYEQPGVDGVRLDMGLAAAWRFSLFYSPEDTWDASGKLARLLGRVGHFDIALSAGQRQRKATDYQRFASITERQDMLGLDLNGELLGIGCWVEQAYHYMQAGDDYWEGVFGADYTFSSGWYVMSEYYHNEQGHTDKSAYGAGEWLRYLTAETKTLAEDQLYIYTLYPLTDLLDIGCSVVYGISDNSALTIPTCEYSLSDDVTLTVFGIAYAGSDESMYAADMGSGGLIRLRAYF